MIPIFGTLLSILSSVTGQIGPNYDPLFYDVMLYIFGTMMFSIFLLGIIGYWIRVHGWSYKDNRERWVDELDRHFENEGIGLIPDNGKYWIRNQLSRTRKFHKIGKGDLTNRVRMQRIYQIFL